MRLKHYNIGAALHLRETDLLIADYLPPEAALRVIKVIITPEGVSEMAEYRIQPNSPTQFNHRVLYPDGPSLSRLAQAVARLAAELSALKLESHEWDPLEYEPAHRLALRYWQGRERVSSGWWPQRLFDDLHIEKSRAASYTAAVQGVWSQLFQLIEWSEPEPEWFS